MNQEFKAKTENLKKVIKQSFDRSLLIVSKGDDVHLSATGSGGDIIIMLGMMCHNNEQVKKILHNSLEFAKFLAKEG